MKRNRIPSYGQLVQVGENQVLQSGGQGFEFPIVHQNQKRRTCSDRKEHVRACFSHGGL